jgi:hypothetical protein
MNIFFFDRIVPSPLMGEGVDDGGSPGFGIYHGM